MKACCMARQQPCSIQTLSRGASKKQFPSISKLQAFVERIHASWTIDRDYLAPPRFGKLVTLDPALLVTPPRDLEVGYVPIVTRQEAGPRTGGPSDPGTSPLKPLPI